MKLFVYGSLKSGEFNNESCLAGQKLIGKAETLPMYKLFAGAFCPYLVRALNGVEIKGEVWEVDDSCLQLLDYIEKNSGYTRKQIQLKTHEQDVQGYIYLGSTLGLKDCGVEWKGELK